MALNKVKVGSNMYQFLNDYPVKGANKGYTWNPIRGKCPHDCSYCYMQTFPQSELHFAENELNTKLGQGNFIFVGSSTDGWCDEAISDWILQTLRHCGQFANRYLFQSKNPERFLLFIPKLPPDSILGTTIESNRYSTFTKAPPALLRKEAMRRITLPKMVSIEPIMDFDLDDMVWWVEQVSPEFVSIGADSKGHNLPEPSPIKTQQLIERLRGVTEVYVKDNLSRLLRQEVPV